MGKPKELAQEFLSKYKIMSLATSSLNGDVSNSIVYFLYEVKENHIYFMTYKESGKYKKLLENPKVAIVVGPNMAGNKLVQILGQAEELDREAGQQYLDQLLAMAYDETDLGIPPIVLLSDSLPIIFRVKIKSMKLYDSEGKSRGQRDKVLREV